MTHKRIAAIAAAALTAVFILTSAWFARDAGAGDTTAPSFDKLRTGSFDKLRA